MKQLQLVVLSLTALVLGRSRGMCTANTQAEDIAALQKTVDRQQEEIAALRAGTKAAPEPSSTLALLCKGAGVELENVTWRIKAGLTEAQAVEVAAREAQEAKERKEKK